MFSWDGREATYPADKRVQRSGRMTDILRIMYLQHAGVKNFLMRTRRLTDGTMHMCPVSMKEAL